MWLTHYQYISTPTVPNIGRDIRLDDSCTHKTQEVF